MSCRSVLIPCRVYFPLMFYLRHQEPQFADLYPVYQCSEGHTQPGCTGSQHLLSYFCITNPDAEPADVCLTWLAQNCVRGYLTLILRRSRTGTVWFYTSTSNKRAAQPELYTKSLTRDLKLMYSRLTLVRISINL